MGVVEVRDRRREKHGLIVGVRDDEQQRRPAMIIMIITRLPPRRR
jgi:hypothetical protein